MKDFMDDLSWKSIEIEIKYQPFEYFNQQNRKSNLRQIVFKRWNSHFSWWQSMKASKILHDLLFKYIMPWNWKYCKTLVTVLGICVFQLLKMQSFSKNHLRKPFILKINDWVKIIYEKLKWKAFIVEIAVRQKLNLQFRCHSERWKSIREI